jgi:DNA polymerase III subunit epsilon
VENILILDTETSGLDPAVDRVVEIGAILWSVRHHTILKCWSTLVRGDSNAAEDINRIPAASLALGLPFEDAVRTLSMFVEMSDAIVAHRAEFDSSFLPTIRQRPWICSKYDIRWPNAKIGDGLVHICLANGIGVSSAHRALTDCLLLARLFESVGDAAEAGLIYGLRPKAKFIAMVPYARKDEAKKASFQWDGERWSRTMAIEDAEKLPFKVMMA